MPHILQANALRFLGSQVACGQDTGSHWNMLLPAVVPHSFHHSRQSSVCAQSLSLPIGVDKYSHASEMNHII